MTVRVFHNKGSRKNRSIFVSHLQAHLAPIFACAISNVGLPTLAVVLHWSIQSASNLGVNAW